MNWLKQKLSEVWTHVKNFFWTVWQTIKGILAWDTNATIIKSRVTMLIGLVTGGVGLMDWSPLLSMDISTGLNWHQVTWLGCIAFIKGIIDEVTRRWNAVSLTP